MALTKPASVENDAFKSAKWDEITAGREFRESDAPTLALLTQWYKIVQQAQDELDNFGSNTAYTNEMGDLKAFPQIATLKTASGEIRQINKQLGICDSVEQEQTRKTNSTLIMVQNNRMKHKKSSVAQAAGQ
jgi:phage terminase small subunit